MKNGAVLHRDSATTASAARLQARPMTRKRHRVRFTRTLEHLKIAAEKMR